MGLLITSIVSISPTIGSTAASAGSIDPLPALTEKISVSSTGLEQNTQCGAPNGGIHDNEKPFQCTWPAISGNGRVVAFYSTADNLVADDSNGVVDVFVRDLERNTTERASITSEGAEQTGGNLPYDPGNYSFAKPAIDYSGRHVAFVSSSGNLAPPGSPAGWSVYIHDRATGKTTWVSRIAADEFPAISDDGQTLVFIHPAPEHEGPRIAIYEVTTGDLDLLPINYTGADVLGTPIDSSPTNPAISGDGSTITFTLGVASGTISSHVYAYDRASGEVELISAPDPSFEREGPEPDLTHSQLSTSCNLSDVNEDGRFVAFTCTSNNLVAGDVSDAGTPETYVRDRQRGTTERLSVSVYAEQPNLPASLMNARPSISADGRFVAFVSPDDQLSPTASNFQGSYAVFVHDRRTRTLKQISLTPDGQPIAGDAFGPDLDALGHNIAYAANGGHVPDDGGPFQLEDTTPNMWVFHQGGTIGVGPTTAQTDANSVRVSGWVSLLGTVIGEARDLEGEGYPIEYADLSALTVTYRPHLQDLLLSTDAVTIPVRQQEVACLNGSPGQNTCQKYAGNPNTLFGFRLTSEDSVYEVRIQGPTSNRKGIEAYGESARVQTERIELFRCDATPCTHMASLKGGYAATRADLTASVPLALLGLSEGDALSSIGAFSGTGTAATGMAPPAYFLGLGPRDEIALPGPVVIPETSVTLSGPSLPPTQAPFVGGQFDVQVQLAAQLPDWITVRACIGADCSEVEVPVH